MKWTPNYLAQLPLHLQLAKILGQTIAEDFADSVQQLPVPTEAGAILGVTPATVKLAYKVLEYNKLGYLQPNGAFQIEKLPRFNYA